MGLAGVVAKNLTKKNKKRESELITTISSIVEQFQSGKLTSSTLVEKSIAAAERSESVFIRLNADSARQQAEGIDKARQASESLPPYAGIPITLKDLFDVQGEVTAAGSRVLANQLPASRDAPVIRNLREAGFLFLGRVNMSEFAFSGMGSNPHYGTPLSIWDRQTGRLPGGSSSGGAVSVAEGIVPGSIGTDTAGSTRIPAAFNGVVGYKPSYGRFPLDGIFPLSPTTDAPGPLANTVECCYLLDGAMAGELHPQPLVAKPAAELSLLLPQAEVMADLDDVVRRTFEQAVERLRGAGCRIKSAAVPALDGLLEIFRTKPLATYEAWQAHRQRILDHGDEYDPFVSWRIASGAEISDDDYQKSLRQRRVLIEEFNAAMQGFDVIIYPTVALLPPPLADVLEPESARPINFRCLRNTATVNYFDGCSISIPCHAVNEPPVGLMLSACHGRDFELFEVALAMERLLRP